jgi:hypothetical protein
MRQAVLPYFRGVSDGVCASLIGVLMTSIDMHLPRFINRMVSTVVHSINAGVLGFLYASSASDRAPTRFDRNHNVLSPYFPSAIRNPRSARGRYDLSALALFESLLLALMIAFRICPWRCFVREALPYE